MVNKYLIGVDAGTTILKAILFDSDCNVIMKAETPTNISSPLPSWIEADMNVLWARIKDCLRKIIENPEVENEKIAGIGLTGIGDGTWIMDKDGNPVRPGLYWCDGRSEKVVNKWLSDGTSEKAFEICGTAIHTGSQCAQLKWLHDNEPENMRGAETIFHCKDWLFYKLTGKITSDETDESLTFFDINTRKYDDELFKIFGLYEYRDKFPDAGPSEENTGNILKSIAEELNLNKDVVIGSGPMDVSASALGGGAVYHGQACSILGSASIHEAVTDRPILTPKMVGMTLCHAHKAKWIRCMAAMSATPNLDWFLREFGTKFRDESERKGINLLKYADSIVENVPVGSEGVIYHPYILPGGERAPFLEPNAKANFSGISVNHSIEILLRSIYEGVGLSMLDCYRNMPVDIKEIILTGGGSKSSVWSQILADITGKTVKIPSGEEYGAKGAALNLGVALGIYKNFEDAVSKTVSITKSFEPNLSNTKKYADIYQVYKMTYEKMRDIWNKRSLVYNNK